MAEQYRFFGSAVGDDREYSQVEFAEVLSTIVDNGYIKDKLDELLVYESTPPAMSVEVSTGEAWINGYWYQNDAVITVPIDASSPTNPRRDLIILRLDVLTSRSIEVTILKGTPSSTPALPSLTQTSQIWEIPLAEVLVGTGVTSIVTANITDVREVSTLRGVSNDFTGTLSTTWTGTEAPYTQVVTVNGILATDEPHVDVTMSGTFSTDELRNIEWGYIYRIETTSDTLTFYATLKPTATLPFRAKVVR